MTRLLALTCGLILATGPMWIGYGPSAPFPIMRGIAVVAVLLTAMALHHDQRVAPPWVSPSFLLPVLAVVLYSLAPASYLLLTGRSPVDPLPGQTPAQARVLGDELANINFPFIASASPAEALVLSFAGIGLVLALLGLDGKPNNTPQCRPPFPSFWAWTLLICGGITFQIGRRGFLPPSLCDLLPPIMLLAAASLVLAGRSRQLPNLLGALAAIFTVIALLTPFQLKLAAYFAIPGVLFLLFQVPSRIRPVLGLLIVVIPVAGAILLGLHRGAITSDKPLWSITETLRWKLALRQAETLYCLRFAQAAGLAHPRGDGGRSPWYFAEALIPRILWPEKPSLSRGDEYGERYCGVTGISNHSGSITLLGEPLVQAGRPGLLTAAMLLGVLSLVVSRLWLRQGPLGAPLVLTIAPWLIDFDQNFSLYAAGSVKAALVCAAILLLSRCLGFAFVRAAHRFKS